MTFDGIYWRLVLISDLGQEQSGWNLELRWHMPSWPTCAGGTCELVRQPATFVLPRSRGQLRSNAAKSRYFATTEGSEAGKGGIICAKTSYGTYLLNFPGQVIPERCQKSLLRSGELNDLREWRCWVVVLRRERGQAGSSKFDADQPYRMR